MPPLVSGGAGAIRPEADEVRYLSSTCVGCTAPVVGYVFSVLSESDSWLMDSHRSSWSSSGPESSEVKERQRLVGNWNAASPRVHARSAPTPAPSTSTYPPRSALSAKRLR